MAAKAEEKCGAHVTGPEPEYKAINAAKPVCEKTLKSLESARKVSEQVDAKLKEGGKSIGNVADGALAMESAFSGTKEKLRESIQSMEGSKGLIDKGLELGRETNKAASKNAENVGLGHQNMERELYSRRQARENLARNYQKKVDEINRLRSSGGDPTGVRIQTNALEQELAKDKARVEEIDDRLKVIKEAIVAHQNAHKENLKILEKSKKNQEKFTQQRTQLEGTIARSRSQLAKLEAVKTGSAAEDGPSGISGETKEARAPEKAETPGGETTPAKPAGLSDAERKVVAADADGDMMLAAAEKARKQDPTKTATAGGENLGGAVRADAVSTALNAQQEAERNAQNASQVAEKTKLRVEQLHKEDLKIYDGNSFEPGEKAEALSNRQKIYEEALAEPGVGAELTRLGVKPVKAGDAAVALESLNYSEMGDVAGSSSNRQVFSGEAPTAKALKEVNDPGYVGDVERGFNETRHTLAKEVIKTDAVVTKYEAESSRIAAITEGERPLSTGGELGIVEAPTDPEELKRRLAAENAGKVVRQDAYSSARVAGTDESLRGEFVAGVGEKTRAENAEKTLELALSPAPLVGSGLELNRTAQESNRADSAAARDGYSTTTSQAAVGKREAYEDAVTNFQLDAAGSVLGSSAVAKAARAGDAAITSTRVASELPDLGADIARSSRATQFVPEPSTARAVNNSVELSESVSPSAVARQNPARQIDEAISAANDNRAPARVANDNFEGEINYRQAERAERLDPVAPPARDADPWFVDPRDAAPPAQVAQDRADSSSLGGGRLGQGARLGEAPKAAESPTQNLSVLSRADDWRVPPPEAPPPRAALPERAPAQQAVPERIAEAPRASDPVPTPKIELDSFEQKQVLDEASKKLSVPQHRAMLQDIVAAAPTNRNEVREAFNTAARRQGIPDDEIRRMRMQGGVESVEEALTTHRALADQAVAEKMARTKRDADIRAIQIARANEPEAVYVPRSPSANWANKNDVSLSAEIDSPVPIAQRQALRDRNGVPDYLTSVSHEDVRDVRMVVYQKEADNYAEELGTKARTNWDDAELTKRQRAGWREIEPKVEKFKSELRAAEEQIAKKANKPEQSVLPAPERPSLTGRGELPPTTPDIETVAKSLDEQGVRYRTLDENRLVIQPDDTTSLGKTAQKMEQKYGGELIVDSRLANRNVAASGGIDTIRVNPNLITDPKLQARLEPTVNHEFRHVRNSNRLADDANAEKFNWEQITFGDAKNPSGIPGYDLLGIDEVTASRQSYNSARFQAAAAARIGDAGAAKAKTAVANLSFDNTKNFTESALDLTRQAERNLAALGGKPLTSEVTQKNPVLALREIKATDGTPGLVKVETRSYPDGRKTTDLVVGVKNQAGEIVPMRMPAPNSVAKLTNEEVVKRAQDYVTETGKKLEVHQNLLAQRAAPPSPNRSTASSRAPAAMVDDPNLIGVRADGPAATSGPRALQEIADRRVNRVLKEHSEFSAITAADNRNFPIPAKAEEIAREVLKDKYDIISVDRTPASFAPIQAGIPPRNITPTPEIISPTTSPADILAKRGNTRPERQFREDFSRGRFDRANLPNDARAIRFQNSATGRPTAARVLSTNGDGFPLVKLPDGSERSLNSGELATAARADTGAARDLSKLENFPSDFKTKDLELIAPSLETSEYLQRGRFREWFTEKNNLDQGTKVHVGLTPTAISEHGAALTAKLRALNVPHKVDTDMKTYLANSLNGDKQTGKFITIYPQSDEQALEVAKAMKQQFKKRGIKPEVTLTPPGEYEVAPGISARYGAFTNANQGKLVTPAGEFVADTRGAGFGPEWAKNPFARAEDSAARVEVSAAKPTVAAGAAGGISRARATQIAASTTFRGSLQLDSEPESEESKSRAKAPDQSRATQITKKDDEEFDDSLTRTPDRKGGPRTNRSNQADQRPPGDRQLATTPRTKDQPVEGPQAPAAPVAPSPKPASAGWSPSTGAVVGVAAVGAVAAGAMILANQKKDKGAGSQENKTGNQLQLSGLVEKLKVGEELKPPGLRAPADRAPLPDGTQVTVACVEPTPCSLTGEFKASSAEGKVSFPGLKFTGAHPKAILEFSAAGFEKLRAPALAVEP